jgi:hypothetical protein
MEQKPNDQPAPGRRLSGRPVRRGTTVVVIRSLMAALLAGLGAVSLADGRVVVGLLLLGLAATNVALTVVMHRRRRQWRARLEQRRSDGQDHLLVG